MRQIITLSEQVRTVIFKKFRITKPKNKNIKLKEQAFGLLFLVGVTRLELATPRPPVWCATTCATPRTQFALII